MQASLRSAGLINRDWAASHHSVGIVITCADERMDRTGYRCRYVNDWSHFAGRVLMCVFFFQAEDGIRDVAVTGVQTCALPILTLPVSHAGEVAMRAVLFLAWARLRRRPARWLLVALGMAGAAVLPVLTANSSSIVAAQALRHGIEALPAGQRSLIVSYDAIQLAPADLAALDGQARGRLSGLSAQPARRQLLYRRLADTAGRSFLLGAADDPARAG